MNKKISAALLTLACFSALTVSAYADGPIGNAINGIGRAGEDIANGVGRAVDDTAEGIMGITRETSGESTTTSDDTTTSDNDTSSGTGSTVTPGDTDGSGATGSGTVGGIADANPPMGVTYGLTAGTAVLAALGVVVSAVRKDKK